MKLTKEQQLLQTIITKAWENETFKQELIANPVETIDRLTETPIKLIKERCVVVCDQTDNSVIYFNIPAKTTMDDIELNEEQLDVVAGGGVIPDPVLTVSAANLSVFF